MHLTHQGLSNGTNSIGGGGGGGMVWAQPPGKKKKKQQLSIKKI